MAVSTDRIEREILLKAPLTRVWQALSNAEEFGQWFGVALAGQTFAAGEMVRGKITGEGCGHADALFEALIVEVTPPNRFAFRWHPYAVDPAVDYTKEESTLVVFDLTTVEGGTLLKVVESGFDKIPATRRAEAFRMNGHGWEGQLQNIGRYVEAIAV